MRPEPPPRFTPGIVERLGLGQLLPTAGRLVLRTMERRPLRTGMSALGVAFSVAILIVGLFMFDGVAWMMDVQFRMAQREDLTVTFNHDLGASAQAALAQVPGVSRVEPFRTVPVRLRSGHREREVAITGLEPGTRLRRIVSEAGVIRPLPMEGVVLSAILAERLQVVPGDSVRVEVLTGRRRSRTVPVAAVVDDLLGVSAHMSATALRRLTGDGERMSGAFLLLDDPRGNLVHQELKEAPAVASVVAPATMLDSFESQLEDSLFVAIGFIIGFASVISVAVIYNGTRIALSERGRELASLRVLGFSRGEVATLLFGEQTVITVLAIPLGWAIGYGFAFLVVTAMESETYRIPLVVTAETYLWTAVITLFAAFASMVLVRRRLDRMDLIAVLKTRE